MFYLVRTFCFLEMSFLYEKITSKSNPYIKSLKKLYTSSKTRWSEGRYVIEGIRLCMDAFLSGAKISCILFAECVLQRDEKVLKDLLECECRKICISDEIATFLSDTKTSQGIFCVVDMEDKIESCQGIKKEILLECIQDPANLGAVLRSAEAFGFERIYLTCDCVDVYNPKVLRASMGAVFRVNFVFVDSVENFICTMHENGAKVYASVPDVAANSIQALDLSTPMCVMIGNEGNGLSKAALDMCDNRVTIPMKGRAESLNASVAASIIMWKLMN